MTKVTLTPSELSHIIDKAFLLGKVYCIDELHSAGFEAPPLTINSEKEWNNRIEKQGGSILHSGDAKLDIVWEAFAMTMRDSLKTAIEYDGSY